MGRMPGWAYALLAPYAADKFVLEPFKNTYSMVDNIVQDKLKRDDVGTLQQAQKDEIAWQNKRKEDADYLKRYGMTKEELGLASMGSQIDPMAAQSLQEAYRQVSTTNPLLGRDYTFNTATGLSAFEKQKDSIDKMLETDAKRDERTGALTRWGANPKDAQTIINAANAIPPAELQAVSQSIENMNKEPKTVTPHYYTDAEGRNYEVFPGGQPRLLSDVTKQEKPREDFAGLMEYLNRDAVRTSFPDTGSPLGPFAKHAVEAAGSYNVDPNKVALKPVSVKEGKTTRTQQFDAAGGLKDKGSFTDITMPNPKDFENATTLRKEFDSKQEVKDYKVLANQLASLEGTLGKIKDFKSLNPADQTLVMTFNKILDPGSVVRESEYARTPENMSVLNRASALMSRVQNGGILNDVERKELVKAANIVKQANKLSYMEVRDQYVDIAKSKGLNPDHVVPRLGQTKDTTASQSSPAVDLQAAARAELARRRGGKK